MSDTFCHEHPLGCPEDKEQATLDCCNAIDHRPETRECEKPCPLCCPKCDHA